MTLRLTIDEQAWRTHVDTVRASTPHLVPVVKGNGYGLGRVALAQHALAWADELAVGTVYELAGITDADGRAPVVPIVALTPAMHLPAELPAWSVPTVGQLEHVEVLRAHGWTGRLAVKLESSMHRHGASAGELRALLAAVRSAGMSVHQYVLHLPLPSADPSTAAVPEQVRAWLDVLGDMDDPSPLSVSHITVAELDELRSVDPGRQLRLRAGTSLWHGDKSFMHLTADVVAVRQIHAGTPFGYRQSLVPAAGSLVMIGAGSAHGIAALDGGLSPFHHARRRMPLSEPPHMHTSMVLVPTGEPVPLVGEWVDVQRPLISVQVDEVKWR